MITQIEKIKPLQEDLVKEWHNNKTEAHEDPFLNLVIKQHRFNFDLWHEEDEARRDDVSDTIIAGVKRRIDKLNQQRNDHIEKLDDYILSMLFKNGIAIDVSSPLNSETAGSIIDRLSIIHLRLFHMNEEVNRDGTDESHIKKCSEKLKILYEQRDDLFSCLTELISELEKGTRRIKVYMQHKMYNDPSLNPAVYKE